MPQHRIFWTDDELELVLASAWAIFNDDKSLTQESVFRMAQQVLPAARQRPAGATTLTRFWKKFRSYRTQHEAQAEPKKTPTQEARHEETKATAIITAPEPEPAPVPEYDTAPGVADLLTGLVLQVLYSPQVRSALRSLVAETLAPEGELEQIQAITWRQPKAQRERALRVVIAGGGGTFQNELRGIPHVDLRFWGVHTNESPHRLRALLQGADVAVAVINYVRHGAMYMIKEREKQGKLRAIYFEGTSAADLRSRLVALVQTSEQPQPNQAH